MRIMLVTPGSFNTPTRWMPLGICHLASYLQSKGHECCIFDRFAMGMKHGGKRVDDLMLEGIRSFAPDIIGLNTVSPVIHDTVGAIETVRKVFRGTIVLGGHHATAFPALTLERMPEVNAVMAGEGEISLGMMADGLDWETIPGLFFRGRAGNGDSRGRVEDLDILPLPAYGLLDMPFYTKPGIMTIRPYRLRVGSMLTSRGCYNQCAFCTESLTFGRGVRFHSDDHVLENIEVLSRGYGCNGITILDNDFLARKERAFGILVKIARMNHDRKVKFCIQANASCIDRESAGLLREAGCVQVEMGIETDSREILERMGKRAVAGEAEKAVELCHKHGISVQANLIMGFEGETIDALEATLAYMKKLKVDIFKWGSLMILPGSRLYEEKGGRFFEEQDWTRENVEGFYRTDHLSGIPPHEKEQWTRRRMTPYQRLIHHRGLWKANNPVDCIRYYTGQLGRRIGI
ncbi:MAG: radical SAM protein [Clostridia bacterium]